MVVLIDKLLSGFNEAYFISYLLILNNIWVSYISRIFIAVSERSNPIL